MPSPANRKVAVLLACALAAAFAASLLIGPEGFSLPAAPEARQLILLEIRLPRAVLGALVGASLGISGAALQGYLRNPLAEPGLIGASGGATLGAVLAIHSGATAIAGLALPLGGLAGAALAVGLVVVLAGERGGPLTLILAGVAVSSLAAALTALVLNLSQNPFAAVEMVFWTMGSLADRSQVHVVLAAPFIIAGMALLLRLRPALDALTLGEAAALNLGFDPARSRLLLIAGTALTVGAATAIAGAIGFVGLVIPHLLRRLVAHRPGLLLTASGLGGAVLVLLADTGLRLVGGGQSLRLGVVTALVGAPFFFWLVIGLRREPEP